MTVKPISFELQNRIFGYATNELPPEGSFKAKIYELVKMGLADEQIEKLADLVKRTQQTTESLIIDPIIERAALKN